MVYKRNLYPAFTIVELLVVIVVIGILAAITIVSYTGITQKAIASALQSDLASAKTQLNMFQVDNLAYPTTISTDCTVSPTTTTPPTNLCLKVSSNNTYSNYIPSNTSNPQTFSLTVSNPSLSYSYIVTNNSKPTSLAPAPLNPVADWLALPQGDHYGNFHDLVTNTDATVTRSTPKTIYDPTTQKIYDVPANKLGIRPRSDGKSGYEAEIEEASTNYLLNSSSSYGSNWSCDGSDGSYCNYNSAIAPDGTNTVTTMHISGAGHYFRQALSVSPSTTYTFSFFVKAGTTNGAKYSIWDNTNVGNIVVQTSYFSQINTEEWTRIAVTFTTPATCIYIGVYPERDSGATGTLYFWGMQLEKGSFPTSYIPTTTTAATRSPDVVTISTNNWSASEGTVLTDTGLPASTLIYSRQFGWYGDGSNRLGVGWQLSTNKPYIYAVSSGSISTATSTYAPTDSFISAGVWDDGAPLTEYINGTIATSTSGTYRSILEPPDKAFIGQQGDGTFYYNGPITRLVAYSRALTNNDIVTITNNIKDGT